MNTLKDILRFLKPHWILATISPIFVLVEAAADLALPDFMSDIINNGVILGDSSIIYSIGIKMFVVTIVGMICGLLSIFAAGHVSFNFGADLREKLFEKITRFSFADIDRLQSDSLIVRITSDVYRVQRLVQASMRLLFRVPFMFIGSIVMFFSIDFSVSSVLLLILPILIFVLAFVLHRVFPLYMVVQKKMDRLNTVIREMMTGIRVVKSYVQEPKEKEKFQSANDDLIEANLSVSKWIVLLGPVLSFVLNLGVVAVVYIGAGEVDAKSVNVGDIMACINYLTQIMVALMMALRMIMSVTEAQASMLRIREVLSINNEVSSIPEDSVFINQKGSVEFKHVSFSYRSSGNCSEAQSVLRDVTFSLETGQTMAIIGGTGSGKSTLVQLFLRFYDVTSGSILINGKDLRSYPKDTLCRHIGLVMQNSVLFSGTIADNLKWGKTDATIQEMKNACRMAQIDGFIESLPDGYEHRVDQGAVNFSGGQKQRLALARVLISNPEIIILDDALSALDLHTEANFLRELNKLNSTKIIIAQRINSIKNADLILILEEGSVIGLGKHADLLRDCAVYKEMCLSQMIDEKEKEGNLS